VTDDPYDCSGEFADASFCAGDSATDEPLATECDPWSGLYLSESGQGCIVAVGPAPEWVLPGFVGLALVVLSLAALVLGQLRR
jgi:hypothetical protein